MTQKFYVKLYHEAVRDRKLGQLPDRLWRRVIEMFIFANEEDDRGYLPTPAEMAYDLPQTAEEIEADLKEIERLTAGRKGDRSIIFWDDAAGFWKVRKLEERQAAIPAAARQKAYRARKRKEDDQAPETDEADPEDGDEPVTKRNSSVTNALPIVKDIVKVKVKSKSNNNSKSNNPETDRNFIRAFSAVVPYPAGNLGHAERLYSLRDEHGQERVLEIAAWCMEKGMHNLNQVISSIETAAPAWKNVKSNENGNGNGKSNGKSKPAEDAIAAMEEWAE